MANEREFKEHLEAPQLLAGADRKNLHSASELDENEFNTQPAQRVPRRHALCKGKQGSFTFFWDFSLEASTFTLLLMPTFNPNRSRSCLSNFFSAAVSDFFLAAGMGAEGTAWTARTMLPSCGNLPHLDPGWAQSTRKPVPGHLGISFAFGAFTVALAIRKLSAVWKVPAEMPLQIPDWVFISSGASI